MGLAEPRKRIKISHDPRNLQWSQSPDSFGARIMQSSGWKPGTALGASSIPIPAHEASAAKVRITVKDDLLGLGASLKSKSVEHQRTGLDAFQGLLGRLNAKDERELRIVEEKAKDKNLAMYVQGRWGGMVWVPGGLLVQDDPKSTRRSDTDDQADRASGNIINIDEAEMLKFSEPPSRIQASETNEERNKRKIEKRQRKEERRARKEVRRLERLQEDSQLKSSDSLTPNLAETDTSPSTPSHDTNTTSVVSYTLQNGRHILRGKNIQAKRMAFADSRGLDQIFMRQQKQEA